jgi:hypothetical protein
MPASVLGNTSPENRGSVISNSASAIFDINIYSAKMDKMLRQVGTKFTTLKKNHQPLQECHLSKHNGVP